MENQERKPRRRRRRRPQEGSQGGPQDHVEIIPLGGMGEIGKNIKIGVGDDADSDEVYDLHFT